MCESVTSIRKLITVEICKIYTFILYILYIALWKGLRVVSFLKIISFTDNVQYSQ